MSTQLKLVSYDIDDKSHEAKRTGPSPTIDSGTLLVIDPCYLEGLFGQAGSELYLKALQALDQSGDGVASVSLPGGGDAIAFDRFGGDITIYGINEVAEEDRAAAARIGARIAEAKDAYLKDRSAQNANNLCKAALGKVPRHWRRYAEMYVSTPATDAKQG